MLEHIQDDIAAIAELAPRAEAGRHLRRHRAGVAPREGQLDAVRRVPRPDARSAGTCASTRATELKAKLRTAGLHDAGSHHAHALHSPYWWLKCAVGVDDDDHPLVARYRRFLEWDIVEPAPLDAGRRARAVTGARQEPRALRRRPRGPGPATTAEATVPDLPGVLTADEVRADRRPLAALQLPTRDDPVVRRRPLRPVEPRRDGDGARRRRAATTRPSGPTSGSSTPSSRRRRGTTTTCPTARSRTPSSTPTCAPTSPPACGTTGCSTGTASFVDDLWPTVERALDVGARAAPRTTASRCGPSRPTAHGRGTTPCSPARRASPTRCACGAAARRRDRPAAARAGIAPPTHDAPVDRPTTPSAFEPKDRWAMDWYYPVLTGALDR